MDHLLELTARAEASHFWFRGFRQFVGPVIAQIAAGRRNLRLIDCGCGTGRNLALLQPHGRAFGFNLTPGGLREAASDGRHVVRADITRIPFPPNSFDIVTAFDVLQCVSHDAEALAEMARIVRPGGTIVLTLAALDVLRGDHAEVWQEVRRYTPASARRLIGGAGLEAQQVSFLFASVFPLMLGVRLTQRLLRPFRTLRSDTDVTVPVAPMNAALSWLLAAEARLSRRIPMPIGSSLLIVASKPDATGTTRQNRSMAPK